MIHATKLTPRIIRILFIIMDAFNGIQGLKEHTKAPVVKGLSFLIFIDSVAQHGDNLLRGNACHRHIN